jgi:hypothetical protein
MLGWLVHEKGIEPHVPVFDKSARTDGTFSRDEFRYDARRDIYLCPGGTPMHTHAGERRCDADLPREQARLRHLRSQAALLSKRPSAQGFSLDPRRRSRLGA